MEFSDEVREQLETPIDESAYPRRMVDMCDTCFRLLVEYPKWVCASQGQGCNRCQGGKRKKKCKREVR